MSVLTKERPVKKLKIAPEPVFENPEPENLFERAIILRPINLTIGIITTNAESVLENVKRKAREYQDLTKYEGDDKKAKDDRALLRKQKELTKTTIKSIEAAFTEPLEPFLKITRDILKEYDSAIEGIDEYVKTGEAREKEKKLEQIQAYFDSKNFDLVPLDKIFDDRWLNKTFKLPDIKNEINEAIAGIYSNIKILEGIADHGMTAKAFYLETLDMAEALRRIETLKANAERLAREKVEREAREVQAQVERNAAEERVETREAAKDERAHSLAAEALDIDESEIEYQAPKIRIVGLEITADEEKLREVKAYLTSRGVAYKKLYEKRNE